MNGCCSTNWRSSSAILIAPSSGVSGKIAQNSSPQLPLVDRLRFVVHERAVRGFEIDDVEVTVALLELGVPARNAVAVEHDVVLAIATDRGYVALQHVPLAELRLHRRVNDHQAV